MIAQICVDIAQEKPIIDSMLEVIRNGHNEHATDRAFRVNAFCADGYSDFTVMNRGKDVEGTEI